MGARYHTNMRVQGLGFIAYKPPSGSFWLYCGALSDWSITPAADETVKIPHADSYENDEVLVGIDRFATATIQEATPALIAAMYGESVATSAVKQVVMREEATVAAHMAGYYAVTLTYTDSGLEVMRVTTDDGTVLDETSGTVTINEEFKVVDTGSGYGLQLAPDDETAPTYGKVYVTYRHTMTGGERIAFTANPTGGLPSFRLLLVNEQRDLISRNHLDYRNWEIVDAMLHKRPKFGGSVRDLEGLQLEFRVRNQQTNDLSVDFGDVIRDV